MKSPIFLFSLPRSGSTLLQKVLMSHKDIASVAEPWLMLPFCYPLKKEGVLAEYGHNLSSAALADFINNLPNKEDDYYSAIGNFTKILYEKQCTNNEVYFLDKTPRYYLIIPEIIKVFPNAKFIFLFRNPVHVMSSMMQTWGKNSFRNLFEFDRDLTAGPKALSDGYNLLKDKAYAIQYENFVTNPEKQIPELFNYLDIDCDNSVLEGFSKQATKGRMGDQYRVNEYSNISNASLDKWKTTFNTRYRQNILIKYINNIDNTTLEIQGYSKDKIVSDIKNIETHGGVIAAKDRIDLIYSNLVKILKPNLWFGQLSKSWSGNRYLS